MLALTEFRLAASRLALGTVQFGLDYGVSNRTGVVPRAETRAILDLAWRSGVDTLDTASAYGESERAIGEACPPDSDFAIVTKTIPLKYGEKGQASIDMIEAGFHQSLSRLGKVCVRALLVHAASDLLGVDGPELWRRLLKLREAGFVENLGVSLYDAWEVDALLDRYPLDVVQLPVNVWDQRLVRDGALSRLEDRGVEIHARSVFLQGLLLMDPHAGAERLPAAQNALRVWADELARDGETPLAAALSFVLSQSAITKVVVGVHSRQHLAEGLDAAARRPVLDWRKFACDDPLVIDPRRWRLQE